ncbi:putative metal-dependent HD superfamily phosphohydrolase [Actinoplanes lutulentus]|uniref:Putative metal-dependent HD superfamily phosphohydrolase n=1 Tax=Actinoplanes lutulentus TaxID=1287878 RepID=A0A327ZCH6_9ACTN|nr:metal-dependent phosphohydrolase [Actinoplanes lutulentus]MBB2945793.1 putative metal-dependent HD superfamily phosphohydrolase [Actinoplanes lutulentus]RAK37842.1 putative metal-dependent HD superfamily phosphohydrolase [Actinoplanes lutulentus]
MTSLPDRFRAAARGAGATAPDADLDAAANYLLGRWSEPQRHYHDVTHLASVLDVVDRFAGLAPDPDRVRLAAWLHDAVYDPRALGDANERDSAEFAEGLLLSLGVPEEVSTDVARLVGLTAGHATEESDPDGELLCDADLAILASDDERYVAYTSAIRREYAHVPDDAFRAGRTQVLTALLELPSIYRHAEIRAEWEDRAQANLKAELEDLA